MSLPLPNVDASLREMEYAFDAQRLDGVGLLSSYDGVYLGDPSFEALFAELNRKNAVVHVHPSIAPKNGVSPIAVPGWCLEFVFDTTRVIANLAATGTLTRYPNLKFTFSHGGGTVPFIARRIAAGVGRAVGNEYEKGEVISLLQSLYYDTALISTFRHSPARVRRTVAYSLRDGL